jgi:hypothetical protein
MLYSVCVRFAAAHGAPCPGPLGTLSEEYHRIR